jgi:hypothetical protein
VSRRPDMALCRAGLHDWTPENVTTEKSGRRRCIACHRAAQARFAREHGATPTGRRAVQERAARRQARTVESARNWGKEWTGPELEVLARGDLTRAQKALLLGRTYNAVANMLRRVCVDPRTEFLLLGVEGPVAQANKRVFEGGLS